MMPTYEEALALLEEYNEGAFHLQHAHIVSDVMAWFADELGYGEEREFWRIVGLLHDLDFERWPDEHCVKSQELMRARGLDERLIHATASHGWGPSKSVQDLEVKSVKKKYKDKKFAAGCSREVIERGAELLGWSLDELIDRTIHAMRASDHVA